MSTGDLVPEATDSSAEEYSSRGIGWTFGLGSRGKHPITSEELGNKSTEESLRDQSASQHRLLSTAGHVL